MFDFRNNPYKPLKVAATTLMLILTPSITSAAQKCHIETKTTTKIEGEIEGVRNLKARSSVHAGKYRICVSEMEVKVHGKWHSTRATYLFGPDMTENEACDRATAAAKLEILKSQVPEKLSNKQLMECFEGERPKPAQASTSATTPKDVIPKMTNKEWNGYKRIDDFGRLPWLK